MRIGIAGLLHESNTFAGTVTERRHFEEAFLHRGAALLPVWRDAHHELGGFIAQCTESGAEMVPLLAGWATPGGPLSDEAYDALTGELVDAVARAAPLDGLLLALHGAMVSQSHDDADGETVARLRAVLGEQCPIVVTLDMHGNVSPRLVARATAIVAYRTYPHIDQRERGHEAAALLQRLLAGGHRPAMAHCKVPLLIHIVRQYTGDGPMAEVYAAAARIASSAGVWSVSVLPGYIYADVPHMGVSVVVVAEGGAGAARHAAALAQYVFDLRFDLNAALPGTERAVEEAMACDGTVCLMDGGDNIGAGGPGDSVVLFEALRRHAATNACAVLLDAEAVRACEAAGVGARVALAVGGHAAPEYGGPAQISGTVRTLHPGTFVEDEARHGGMRAGNQGPTAVVATDDGHTVVLNSLRIMPTSLAQLTSLGLCPSDFQFIIVKGVTAPLAAYAPIAGRVIAVDTPGVTRAGPDTFVYRQRPRPLFPLETDFAWRPAPVVGGGPA